MQNKSVKKSIEKSKHVIEENAKWSSKKFAEKDQQVYNNGYELRSRAIKKTNIKKINGCYTGKNRFHSR